MSVRRLAAEQPGAFAFTPENLDWAKGQIKKYPEGKQASAVLALLWRAQEQMGGWLPEPALRYIADMLGMAYIRIYEIATFYTMFNLAPVAQINKYYYEDLTPESLARLLTDLKAGREITPGPQNGRHSSEPVGGATTLLDPELYRNELPDDAPPNYELESPARPAKGRKPKAAPKDK